MTKGRSQIKAFRIYPGLGNSIKILSVLRGESESDIIRDGLEQIVIQKKYFGFIELIKGSENLDRLRENISKRSGLNKDDDYFRKIVGKITEEEYSICREYVLTITMRGDYNQ